MNARVRAVTIDRRGRVAVREVPEPPLGRREVRIAVDTSGVGSWDAEMRPEGRELLVVPGTDGAGVVRDLHLTAHRLRRKNKSTNRRPALTCQLRLYDIRRRSLSDGM